ncbi:hypothetical protein D3C76_886020 [compost metagenome]
MHEVQGPRQARIGKTGHHAGLLIATAQDVPQQQDHHQLEQPIHHRLATAGTVEGFVEQPLQRVGQGRDFIQFQHQVIRQRRGEGVTRAAVEVQGRAYQLRIAVLWGKQAVAIRPGEKDQRRLADVQLTVIREPEGQLARLEQMQMTAGLAAIERCRAAKRTAVKGPGIDTEMRKQGGQAIHEGPRQQFWTICRISSTICTQ